MAEGGAPTRGPRRSTVFLGWEPVDHQCQATRAGEGRQTTELEPGFTQRRTRQALEIARRAALHSRRDLLAEEFEQELRHVQPTPSAADQARAHDLHSSRTRPM
jgi:hypothetical protein